MKVKAEVLELFTEIGRVSQAGLALSTGLVGENHNVVSRF